MKLRYVYFDKKTGIMTDILSKRKRGRAKYVITDEETVGPIVAGKKSWLDLIVAYNRDEKNYVLLEKDNIIKLRYYGDKLYKIPKTTIEDYDLRIDLFAGGNALEISLDPSRMSTMYGTDFREEVKFEKGTELKIYIRDAVGEKDLETITVDAQKLLENGQLFYELKNNVDAKNVSFYTLRVFDKYMWRTGKTSFLSPIRDKIRFEIQKADLKRKSEKFEYHLVVKKTDDGVTIRNNIENIKIVKIFDDIEFFIVDKYDSAILHEKFVLQPSSFKIKNIDVSLKTDLKNKTILYNHKHISILMEEDKNERSSYNKL